MRAGELNSYARIIQLESQRSLGAGQLAAYLHGADRRLAVRAALAIGRTKQAEGVTLLTPEASAPDPAMRAMAVYGLGLIAAPGSVTPVLRALYDHAAGVRVAALDAATRLQLAHRLDGRLQSDAESRIARMLQKNPPVVAGRAAVALESFSDGPAAAAALRALVGRLHAEPSREVRAHIAWALYRGFAKEVPRNVLLNALRDPDEDVRIAAVRAFGRRAQAADVAVLRPLTGDPSWRVQEQALESIKVLQGGAPTEHLKAIPPGVHLPAAQPDPLAGVQALARTPASGKPGVPLAADAITQPRIDPVSAQLVTGPAPGPHPRVRIVTTKGDLYLELYPEWAPLTVENFLNLANRGYYDNNPWFRIVPDFVVQTGDPTGNGNGDAGYTIPAEENPIEQNSYIISMGLNYTDPPNAHAIRDSAGTQFYITLSPQYHLNSDFTVFGRVIGGSWVLGHLIESDKIVRVERLPDAP